MTIPRSAQSSLFTEAEEQQLQLGDEPERWSGREPGPYLGNGKWKHAPNLESSRREPGSIPIAPMQREELDDLLAEALHGHRAVLEELASMQERLMGESIAVRTAIDRVTNLVMNLEYEEDYDDALQA